MAKVLTVLIICGGLTVLAGFVNIALGIVAMMLLYPLAESLLSK